MEKKKMPKKKAKPIKTEVSDSLTNRLLSKWASPDLRIFDGKTQKTHHHVSAIGSNFLELPKGDAENFLRKTLEEMFFAKHFTPVFYLSKEKKARMLVFFLLQMARYFAPRDNNEFLIKILVPLEKNPIFSNLMGSLIHVDIKIIKKGTLNIPTQGVFLAPCSANRHVYAIPRSPTEVFLVYIGEDPMESLSDEDIINFSYGKVNQSIILSKDNKPKDADVAKQQIKNKGEVGNLSKQLEQTKTIVGLISEIIKNVPGVKNNNFLLKPMDLALKIWQR